MDEQKKYEVIKSLVDHPDTANKDIAALIVLLPTPNFSDNLYSLGSLEPISICSCFI